MWTFKVFIFNHSIVKAIFPDDRNFAKITPIYKVDNISNGTG